MDEVRRIFALRNQGELFSEIIVVHQIFTPCGSDAMHNLKTQQGTLAPRGMRMGLAAGLPAALNLEFPPNFDSRGPSVSPKIRMNDFERAETWPQRGAHADNFRLQPSSHHNRARQ
jgi:hypothetical protein